MCLDYHSNVALNHIEHVQSERSSIPELVLVNLEVYSHPYCTHKLSGGKRAPFLCGVEINRIRDLGDLGGIIRLCIGERQQR